MNDHLCNARYHLDAAANSLRCAMSTSSAVESIVLLPLIGRVMDARTTVAALIGARITDEADRIAGRSKAT